MPVRAALIVAIMAVMMIAAGPVLVVAEEFVGQNKPRKFMPVSEIGAIQGREPAAPTSDQVIGAQAAGRAGALRSPSGDGDYGYDPIEQKGPSGGASVGPQGAVGFGTGSDEGLGE